MEFNKRDKRIHITMTEQLLKVLDEEQIKTGAPRAELIRRAIVYKYGDGKSCDDKGKQ